jgi:peroxiredoxin
MKKLITISIIILSGRISLAQNDFSKCYDTLFKHFKNDTVLYESALTGWQKCIKGQQMPYLSVETISGEKINTKDLLGKVLVINLWFTACLPCIAELPALNRLVKEYKGKDVVFLGLSTDTKERLVSDFFPKHKFDFIIVPNAAAVIQKIGQTGYPTTYVIDKKGNVQIAWNEMETDISAETEAYVKAKPIIDELLKAE